MKKFAKPNTAHGFECPICHSGKEEPVVLVPIPGTEEGNICQAKQVHAELRHQKHQKRAQSNCGKLLCRKIPRSQI